MDTVLVIAFVLLMLFAFSDWLAMAATFLLTEEKAGDRELQWLRLKLAFLKSVAREIGRTEAQLASREPAAPADEPDEPARKG